MLLPLINKTNKLMDINVKNLSQYKLCPQYLNWVQKFFMVQIFSLLFINSYGEI